MDELRLYILSTDEKVEKTAKRIKGIEIAKVYYKPQECLDEVEFIDADILILDLRTDTEEKYIPNICMIAGSRGIDVIGIVEDFLRQETKDYISKLIPHGVTAFLSIEEVNTKNLVDIINNYPEEFDFSKFAEAIKVEKEIVREKVVEVKTKVEKVYERPEDFRKCVGLTGYPGAGTTTLIIYAAYYLSKEIKVAIVDLNENRDLYDIFCLAYGEEFKNQQRGLLNLLKGIITPLSLAKNIDLFTCPYGINVDLEDLDKALEAISYDYDLILIDLDYDTALKVAPRLFNLYIVQGLDITSIKHNTEFQKQLSEATTLKKVKYILNKVVSSSTKPKDIVECLKTYTTYEPFNQEELIAWDIKYLEIPFDITIVKGTSMNVYDLLRLEKQTQKAIEELANDIYKIGTKERKGLFGILSRR